MSSQEMNVTDHLEELRKRIMISLGAFLLIFILAFIFVEDLFAAFTRDLDMPLTVLSPLEIITIYFSLTGVIALALTIPIILFQVWLFVKPGLTDYEKKVTLWFVPASFILFLLGLAFGYFVVLPVVLNFLTSLAGETFQTMFTAEKYFQFVLRMTVPFSILFELPLVIMFLTGLGIISPVGMRKNRKYAYFFLFLISVLISPPDLMSDVLVMIPLIFLYEISIFLSGVVMKRKAKKMIEEG